MSSESGNKLNKSDLDQKLNELKNQHIQISDGIEQYIVNKDEDLPNFGNIQVYDYDKDIKTIKKSSQELIQTMADLYLKESPDMLDNPYIIKKIEEDSKYYGQTQLLHKMSEKLLLQQLRQIDQGDNTPKMYEVANQTMNQISQITKDGRNARWEIEKMYKELRKDFGLNEVVNKPKEEDMENSEEQTFTIDPMKLNDIIDGAMKNKDLK